MTKNCLKDDWILYIHDTKVITFDTASTIACTSMLPAWIIVKLIQEFS